MDSSTAHTHHQQETLEMVVSRSKAEKKGIDMQGLKCPRCDSTNTKFCYYNNYSLSQPRYICKSCRRYWTKGGTLRNVPVGGGYRKNKRSSSSAKHHPIPTPIPPLSYASNDLTLAIARLQKQTSALDDRDFSIWTTPTTMPRHHAGDVLGGGAYVSPSSSSGLIDALRSGFNLETPSHNLFYGLGNGNMEMGGGIHDFSGGATSSATPAAAPATVKHEMCSDREGESRVLWGLPWQSIGDGATADFDSGRSANWNGIGASSWQGLLNSPLM